MTSIIKGFKYFYSNNKIDNFKRKLTNSLSNVADSNYNNLNKRILFDFFEESLNSFTQNLLFISTIFLTLLNPINKFLVLILEPLINNLKFSASSAISRIKENKIAKPLKENFDKYIVENEETKLKSISKIESIKINDLNVNFNEDKNQNLYSKNIDLDFEKGKKYYICGKSGSGKSTLIKSILKEVFVSNGTVKINDISVEEINQSNIYNDLIFIDNKQMEFYGSAKEIITFYSENINTEKLNNAIDKVNIDFDIDRQFNSLSTGEKQRTKLAWCFYYNKNVIIFDEALSNIDHKTSEVIENNVLDLGTTFINISHYPNLANLTKYNFNLNLDELVSRD